jgi:hypothetical protein
MKNEESGIASDSSAAVVLLGGGVDLKLQILEEVLVDEPLVGVHLGQRQRIFKHVTHLAQSSRNEQKVGESPLARPCPREGANLSGELSHDSLLHAVRQSLLDGQLLCQSEADAEETPSTLAFTLFVARE